MAYVYRHIRLDKNQPFYIGIGSDDYYNRAHSKKNRNKYWKNITRLTKYDIEILMDNLTWEKSCEKEKEFIALYGRKDLNKGILCNCTDGGEGVLGLTMSNETRNKIRIANTGKKQSADQIAKRVEKLKGEKNPWFGKKFSEEYRKKLSEAKKGKKRNVEVMNNLHACLRKKILDLETNKIYNSINDLAKEYNVHSSTASRWVKSKNLKFKIIK
jgi:hypothetical protein